MKYTKEVFQLYLGIVAGLGVGIYLGICLHSAYLRTDYKQIRACEELYLANIDPNEPEIQAAMKEQGFKNVKELVKNHCEYWVTNGQKFE